MSAHQKQRDPSHVNAATPRITVITPSLNQAEFLPETIESIISQQYPNLEYFIIDGGSTDGTNAVIHKYESFVAYSVSEKDGGQAEAINKGLKRATGDLLCWINSDDLLEPDALLRVARHYQTLPFHFVYGDGWVMRRGRRRRKSPGIIAPNRLLVRDPIQQPSTFWTRDVLERVGLLDESLHFVFDWEFFIRVSLQFTFSYLPTPLSTYRIHPGHKSSSGGRRRAAEIMTVIRRYAPEEWKSVFEDLWKRYDDLEPGSKQSRLLRAGLLCMSEPSLLLRHGPSRLATAMLSLL